NNPDYRRLWVEYAQKIGLDITKFQNDMAGMQAKSRVEQDRKRGIALNVGSTPYVLVNGKNVATSELTVDGLKRAIDTEIQAATASAVSVPANVSANSK
ncbi:MAG: thioredoxin domain-containing protein, partial [Pyrinomonadaceae bacterium]